MRTGQWQLPQVLHRTPWKRFKYVRGVPKDIQHLEGRPYWIKYLGDAHGLAHEHAKRILVLRVLAKGEPQLHSIIPSHEGQASAPSLKLRAEWMAKTEPLTG